ncbi:hypothetical protein Clacol_007545 [Clathrus columnatus]|uniref:Major facilitator superfamily (MFS) profile domain-containing protein n=1 Tax=Clathrus columnatus TaxID=1419009 RepID=A0AAV5AIF0_9AGAM|nr:hypothetical protein Clacol_007545 [Clathrus columnatus]
MSLDRDSSSQSSINKTALIADLSSLPPYRKVVVLIVLCAALFLDTFNNSSLFSAIPPISTQLNIPDSQSVWLLGAYQLTFAALLLICGRLSDLYNPKWIFVIGASSMGAFALGAGFVREEIPLIVLRALMGAGGALTIPSSQHLIVHMFTNPESQAKAIAVFGGMGGIGLVFGLLIGALFVQFVSWPWVFYFGAIISGCIAIAIFLLVPNVKRSRTQETRAEKILRFRRLDLFGVAIMTAALILFIFAVTSGSSTGWGSAQVIAPLILSVFLAVGFFIWEAYVPEDYAAVLPVALGVLLTVPLATILQSKIGSKRVLLLGFTVLIIGSILLPFVNAKDRYWRFGFPGFLLGTAGASLIYATTNITLLSNTPSEISGIVSALFIGAAQTGAAAGLAIVTSIQTSVEIHHGGPNRFNGRAAGLWFLLAAISVFGVLTVIFMKDTIRPVETIRLEVPEKNVEEQQAALPIGEEERVDEGVI